MTKFVERDGNGDVIGVYNRPQPGRAEEAVRNDDPDLLTFVDRPKPERPSVALRRAIRLASDLAELKAALLGAQGTAAVAAEIRREK